MSRDEAKIRVLQASDIVQLIGEHISITPRGHEFVSICPFHDDHRPSMRISPAKQIFKCFACGTGGDVFTFMMEYHKMTFPEALKTLADRANIELPKYSGKSDGTGADTRQSILDANVSAVRFFQRSLKQNDPAQKYLADRSINAQSISDFGIGYAPDSWDALANAAIRNKADVKALVEAGLIAPRKQGAGHYDRLRHRIIFPIFDTLKRPIAFGGRILPGSTRGDQSDAKYLNSPDTPVFNKSKTLFGIHLAHQPIKESHTAIIVEGYTDVIACHQAGVKNVVATLGTALTPQHAQQLRRYCDRVILVFDADDAGQAAAERALSVFFDESIDIDIAVLPDKLDPADLLTQPNGLNRWQAAMTNAVDAMTFQFNRLRAAFDASDTITAKQRIAEDYLRNLVQLGLNRIEAGRRGLIKSRLADLLRIDVASIDEIIRKMPAPSSKRPTFTSPTSDLQKEPTSQATAKPETPSVKPVQPGAEQFDESEVFVYDESEMEYAEPILDGEVLPTDSVTASNGSRSTTPRYAETTKARRDAERCVVAALFINPSLFHCALADGRDFSEAVVPGEFEDPFAAKLYGATYEWLLDSEELSIHDVREMFDDEVLIRAAFDLFFELDVLTESNPNLAAERFYSAVAALDKLHAETEYKTQRQQLREAEEDTKTDDPHAEVKRLQLAIMHTNAHPSAARLPRVRK